MEGGLIVGILDWIKESSVFVKKNGVKFVFVLYYNLIDYNDVI